jgi:antitoxin (DNA-binding transcriptional repressor) of toxin-antitoxin stability system
VKRATISQTKNQLSALLELVKRGEEVLVLERDVPIARIVPVERLGRRDADMRLADLERRGVIRRPRRKPDPGLLDRLGPPPKVDGDILDALLKNRDEER